MAYKKFALYLTSFPVAVPLAHLGASNLSIRYYKKTILQNSFHNYFCSIDFKNICSFVCL